MDGYENEDENEDENGDGSNRKVCPLCEDYVGSAKSVQQHITGSRGVHAGEMGSEHMDDIEQSDVESDEEQLEEVAEIASEADPDDVKEVRREMGEDGEEMVTVVVGAGLAFLLWRLFGAGSNESEETTTVSVN